MKISKVFKFNSKVALKLSAINNKFFYFLFFSGEKVLLRIVLNNYFLSTKNNCLITTNSLSYTDHYLFLKLCLSLEKNYFEHYKYFSRLYMVGLGFKNFVLGEKLYILVGDCNYIIFNIPKTLKIICKKNQIYTLSNDKVEMFNFMQNIKKIKKPNFYKGKGVLEFKNFKFTKLKVGKKQRFM